MEKELRKTGIDIFGNVSWGTHFCQFYQTPGDLTDILVPYLKAGLENNEFCMWITAKSLNVKKAKASLKKIVRNLDDYIEKGQIEILDYSQWYTRSGKLDADRVLDSWVKKETQALERGFDGLRFTGDTYWLEDNDWKSFTEYEETINNIIGNYKMLAVCSYSLDKCNAAEIMDVVANHRFALVKRKNSWEIIESSERKRTEELLRESDEKYRNLVERSNDGVAIIYQDNTVGFLNTRLAEMWGGTIDEVVGTPFTDYVHPDELARVVDHYRRRMAGESVSSVYETVLRRKDGSKAYAELNANIITYEGKPANMVIVRDITERKRADEAFQESESRYRAFFEKGPDGVVILDPETTRPIEFNDQVCQQLGYSREEFALLRVSDIDVKETAKEIQESIRKGMEKGYNDFETLHRTKQGEIRHVHVTGQVIEIMGNPVYHCIWRDITERKRADEALRVSEKRYRGLFENSTDFVYTLDLKGNFTDVNKAAEDLTGYTKSELIGMNYREYTPEYTHERISKAFKSVLNEDEPLKDFPLEVTIKDGTKRYFETCASPLKIGEEIIGLQGSSRDITERKRIEDELLRTQKLESVGLLAGGIAHDFNNTLTTILGNLSMARDLTAPKSEIFELLSEAETASKRAQTLTKQLLTFAKGGIPVKETASIKDIIKESSLFVIHGSKSGCEFSIAEDLWSVEADVGQISQVINNIVINANQAMPEGGIIEIKAENLIIDEGDKLHLKPGRYVWISFKDEGIGIAEKHLSKIFDPYFSTKQAGSGLGLATAYSVIKKHDGIIMAESMLGIGTAFHIYLPASEKKEPEKKEDEVIKGHGRILLMDDEASLRKMAGRMLDRLGYEPGFAKDGDEAIRMVKEAKESKKSYDAVILDLTVPGGMGGKETIRKLLEIDPEIKAIVSSGYSDDPVLANFQEYGFKGMIPKPFELLLLSKVLHEVLQSEKE